jgi:hypothetical protein
VKLADSVAAVDDEKMLFFYGTDFGMYGSTIWFLMHVWLFVM